MRDEIIKITVDEVIGEIKQKLKNYTQEGLCIYYATNIGALLAEQEIEYWLLTTSSFVDNDYYHEFIIAKGEEKYYLIDPSFGQFVNDGKRLIHFDIWPADKLKTYSNGNIIENQLLTKGLCMVSEEDVKVLLS